MTLLQKKMLILGISSISVGLIITYLLTFLSVYFLIGAIAGIGISQIMTLAWIEQHSSEKIDKIIEKISTKQDQIQETIKTINNKKNEIEQERAKIAEEFNNHERPNIFPLGTLANSQITTIRTNDWKKMTASMQQEGQSNGFADDHK